MHVGNPSETRIGMVKLRVRATGSDERITAKRVPSTPVIPALGADKEGQAEAFNSSHDHSPYPGVDLSGRAGFAPRPEAVWGGRDHGIQLLQAAQAPAEVSAGKAVSRS